MQVRKRVYDALKWAKEQYPFILMKWQNSFFRDNLILPLALQESLSVVLFYPCEIKSQTESKNLLHQRLHQNDIKRNTD